MYRNIPFSVNTYPQWDTVGHKVGRMNAPYEDAEQLAQAIRNARRQADLSQVALGQRLGVSDKKVIRWEQGNVATLGDTREKRFAVAAMVAAATGDQSLLGGPTESASGEIEEIRQTVGAIATLLTTEGLGPEAEQLLKAELAAARKWSASGQHSAEPGTAIQNP
jgi:transcriptional regulator with XRE-family HTH domain